MKKWYASKTVWFNVIMAVLGAVSALSNTLPQYAELLSGITAVGNVVLRVWFTNTGIGTSTGPTA